MSRPDALEAHAPVHPRWQRPVGYTPTTDGAPKLPNKPRTPHIPHINHGGRILTGALISALTLTAVEGFVRPHGTTDPSGARAGEVPAEQMRYPWDSGNLHLELQYKEIDQNIFEFSGAQITNDPETVDIGDGKYVQFVLGSEYGENDDPYGHVTIPLINDVMKGGVWEKSVDKDGKPITDAEGKPVLHHYGYVEQEPGQEGMS